MNTAFIKGLWGIPDPNATDNLLRMRAVMAKELRHWKKYCPSVPFKTYAYGKDNCDILASLGIDCVKLSDDPVIWDNSKYMHRHKIEIMRVALESYDEIVWLDWDSQQLKEIPSDFWDKISVGQPFQACLKQQNRPQCLWRPIREDQRFLPCTGVTYVRGRETIDRVIDCWTETGMNANDEIAFAKMSDDILGGWKGPEAYCSNFEPLYAMTKRCRWCTTEILVKKDLVFKHQS